MGVITAPSFVQVTVVAGPPVEVQVRVLDSLSNVSSVMLGAPAFERGQDVIAKVATCKFNDSKIMPAFMKIDGQLVCLDHKSILGKPHIYIESRVWPYGSGGT